MSTHRKTPFFSVLVPVFNSALFLSECVESVLDQTCDDYEIVLVNDGSTDGSWRICEEYQSRYPDRIVCFAQGNRGSYAARCKAAQLARGAFLVFLDSDDALRSDALGLLKSLMQQRPVDLIVFKGSRNADYSEDRCSRLFYPDVSKSDDTVRLLKRMILTTDRVNNLCFKVVDRRAFKKASTRIDRKLFLAEDKLQCLFLYDVVDSASLLDEVLYFYRPNESSVTCREYRSGEYENISYVGNVAKSFMDAWGLGEDRSGFYALFLSQVSNVVVRLASSSETRQFKTDILRRISSDALFVEAMREGLCQLPARKRVILSLAKKQACLVLKCYVRVYLTMKRVASNVRTFRTAR